MLSNSHLFECFNVFEPQIVQLFISKNAYNYIRELLDVLLWFIFVGILKMNTLCLYRPDSVTY
jgi:hypothetical protein